MGLVFMPLNALAFATLDAALSHRRVEPAQPDALDRPVGRHLDGHGAAGAQHPDEPRRSGAARHRATTLPGIDLGALERFGVAVRRGAWRWPTAMINQQAAMIAYLDDFYLMSWISLAAMPLVLLLQKPKGQGRGGATPNRRQRQHRDESAAGAALRPLRHVVGERDPGLLVGGEDVRAAYQLLRPVERPRAHDRDTGAARIGVIEPRMASAAEALDRGAVLGRDLVSTIGPVTLSAASAHQRLNAERAPAPALADVAMAGIDRRQRVERDRVAARAAAAAAGRSYAEPERATRSDARQLSDRHGSPHVIRSSTLAAASAMVDGNRERRDRASHASPARGRTRRLIVKRGHEPDRSVQARDRSAGSPPAISPRSGSTSKAHFRRRSIHRLLAS